MESLSSYLQRCNSNTELTAWCRQEDERIYFKVGKGHRGSSQHSSEEMLMLYEALSIFKEFQKFDLSTFSKLKYDQRSWCTFVQKVVGYQLHALVTTHPKATFSLIARLLAWANEFSIDRAHQNEVVMELTVDYLAKAIDEIQALIHRIETKSAWNKGRQVSTPPSAPTVPSSANQAHQHRPPATSTTTPASPTESTVDETVATPHYTSAGLYHQPKFALEEPPMSVYDRLAQNYQNSSAPRKQASADQAPLKTLSVREFLVDDEPTDDQEAPAPLENPSNPFLTPSSIEYCEYSRDDDWITGGVKANLSPQDSPSVQEQILPQTDEPTKAYTPTRVQANPFLQPEAPTPVAERVKVKAHSVAPSVERVTPIKPKLTPTATPSEPVPTPTRPLPLACPLIILEGNPGSGQRDWLEAQLRFNSSHSHTVLTLHPQSTWQDDRALMGALNYHTQTRTTQYVCTPFLKFVVKGWQALTRSGSLFDMGVKMNASQTQAGMQFQAQSVFFELHKDVQWLVLDAWDATHAPTYLSTLLDALEATTWTPTADGYSIECPAIIPAETIASLGDPEAFFDELGLTDSSEDQMLRALWQQTGLCLPFNLVIVAFEDLAMQAHRGLTPSSVFHRAQTLCLQNYRAWQPLDFFKESVPYGPVTYPQGLPLQAQDFQSTCDVNAQRTLLRLNDLAEVLKRYGVPLTPMNVSHSLKLLRAYQPQNEQALYAAWDDIFVQLIYPLIRTHRQWESMMADLKSVLTPIGARRPYWTQSEEAIQPLYLKC